MYLGPLEGPLYRAFVEASLNWDQMGIWTYSHLDDRNCAIEHKVEYPSVSLIRHFDNEIFRIPYSYRLNT